MYEDDSKGKVGLLFSFNPDPKSEFLVDLFQAAAPDGTGLEEKEERLPSAILRRKAAPSCLTNRLFRGCPPSYSAAYSAGYSAGFRAHSAGTKSQQHAHICIQNSLSAMLITTEAEAGGGG